MFKQQGCSSGSFARAACLIASGNRGASMLDCGMAWVASMCQSLLLLLPLLLPTASTSLWDDSAGPGAALAGSFLPRSSPFPRAQQASHLACRPIS